MVPSFTKSGAVGFRPEEIDTDSSPTTVYLRKDYEEGVTEEGVEEWRYMEAKLTRTEYAEWLSERNSAQIAYIAMMTDVEV